MARPSSVTEILNAASVTLDASKMKPTADVEKAKVLSHRPKPMFLDLTTTLSTASPPTTFLLTK